MRLRVFGPFFSLFILLAPSSPARAADRQATPADYTTVLATLVAGDTLHLAAGTYTKYLNIKNLQGAENAWITITGPESGPPAIFTSNACCNTVEITNSAYVAVMNITVDGGHVDGAFGLSAKNGTGNLVHHVRVEGCTFVNQDGSQQHVAISTKTPTWGWSIRRNRIIGAGTGLYLGNSDGSSPFVAGLIEGNLIMDTIGYNAQIKFQNAWPNVPGLPAGPNTTIIRDNVLIKNDQPSPDGDRPNLLVDRGPDTGPGSMDRFEIYGNLFLHNPRESLLQVSGRVSVHDNVFVDVAGSAVRATNHSPVTLVRADIYNNTIYSAGTGILFANAASAGDAVVGNLIFATTPTAGPIAGLRDNMTDSVANALKYVAMPSVKPGMMDFYPLPGRCAGTALDLGPFHGDSSWAFDFNGRPKGGFTYRGAYAGEGKNPGWALAADRKVEASAPPVGDGGAAGDLGTAAGDAATGGDMDAAAPAAGCHCRAGGRRGFADLDPAPAVAIFLLLGGQVRSRRRGSARRAAGAPGSLSL